MAQREARSGQAFRQAVAHRIAYFRSEAGMTQAQLADVTGLSKRNIERWETGVYLPPLDAWLAIATALDVPLHTFRPPQETLTHD
jgi:DNA-binding XRE family transcriptional regulator